MNIQYKLERSWLGEFQGASEVRTESILKYDEGGLELATQKLVKSVLSIKLPQATDRAASKL